MFAIVETSGKQYRVAAGETITVDHVQADVGSTITLDRVLLVAADGEPRVGAPVVAGVNVTARVVEHFLGDKVRTFKYIQRRRRRTRRGFRHSHTTLEIVSING